MINILKIKRQLGVFLAMANVSLAYKEKLSEDLDVCGEKELSFVSIFLNGDIDNIPVNEDGTVHVTRSLGRLLDIAHGRNTDDNEFYDHKEVYSTVVTADILCNDVMRSRFLKSILSVIDGSNPGVAVALTECLENVSNKKLDFPGFSDDDLLLYRKIYVVLLYHYFVQVSDLSKVFFLTNPLLIIALSLGFDVKEKVFEYLNFYNTLKIRKDICLDFATAINANRAVAGRDLDGKQMTVHDWIIEASVFGDGGNAKDRGDVFLSQNVNVLVNTVFWQEIIGKILNLYFALVSGDFVLDEKTRKVVEDATEIVPDEHLGNFAIWIVSDEAKNRIKNWLKIFSDKQISRFGLVSIFSTLKEDVGVDLLGEEANIEALYELGGWLKEQGLVENEDLIFFDENVGQFKWVEV